MNMVVYNKINESINMGCNFRLLAYIFTNLIYNALSKYIPHRDTTSIHMEFQNLKTIKMPHRDVTSMMRKSQILNIYLISEALFP